MRGGFRHIQFGARNCVAVACAMFAFSAVLYAPTAFADEEQSAHDLADKFSNATQSKPANKPNGQVLEFNGPSTKPIEGEKRRDVLQKIESIKKKADAAWKKSRQSNSEVQPTKVKTIKVERKVDQGAVEAQKKLKAEAQRQKRAAQEAKRKAAQKAEARRKAEQQRKQREAKRLAEKRKAEAEEKRRAAEARAREEERQRAQAEARRTAEKKRAERAHREAERQRQDDARRRSAQARRERERAQRAEQERLERQAEARRIEDENRLADQLDRESYERETNESYRRAEERRVLEERRSRDWSRIAEEEERRKRMSDPNARWSDRSFESGAHADRAARSRQLSERLRRARASRRSLGGQSFGHDRNSDPLGKFGPRGDWARPYSQAPTTTRATVLLIMEVGKSGIRTWSKTADPMLCVNNACYLSEGYDQPAKRLSRAQAFGPSVALFTRGMACRSRPACIFRNVDFQGYDALVQPVDLRFLRHDRREKRMVPIDTSCRLIKRRLSCGTLVRGTGWRAWIVPENVANEAGPLALKRAIDSGLKVSHSASIGRSRNAPQR